MTWWWFVCNGLLTFCFTCFTYCNLTPKISVPHDIGIVDIDLCRAYVNLLDNAINAAKQFDESQREIKVESYIDSDVLYIKTVNPNPPESEKEKQGDHGNGLSVLQDILKIRRFINNRQEFGYYYCVAGAENGGNEKCQSHGILTTVC